MEKLLTEKIAAVANKNPLKKEGDGSAFSVWVGEKSFLPVMRMLKEDKDLNFKLLTDICCLTDRRGEKKHSLIYHLISVVNDFALNIICDIESFSAQSCSGLWKSAGFFEREIFEMFGIRFNGNHNLKPLVLPDRRQFQPLRKEYPVIGTEPFGPEIKPDIISNTIPEKTPKEEVSRDKENSSSVKRAGYEYNTRGSFKINFEHDGEKIINAAVDIGFNHRGLEKLAENMGTLDFLPFIRRLDSQNKLHNLLTYILAVETLAEIRISDHCRFMRMLVLEFFSIRSQLNSLFRFLSTLGFAPAASWMTDYTKKINNLFSGMRDVENEDYFFNIGGEGYKTESGALKFFDDFLSDLLKKFERFSRRMSSNRFLLQRCEGLSILDAQKALDFGITGVNLRASGIGYDLRKIRPYLKYDELDIIPVSHSEGDVLARYFTRIDEVFLSAELIRQILGKIKTYQVNSSGMNEYFRIREGGKFNVADIIQHTYLHENGYLLRKGTASARIENPDGEFGIFISGTGEAYTDRLKISSPSFPLFQLLPEMLTGIKLPDLAVVVSSFAPSAKEADK